MQCRSKLVFAIIAVVLSACMTEEEAARMKLEQRWIPFTENAFVEQATEGEVEILELFLTAGMDPNSAGGEWLKTPVFAAAMMHHAEAVRLLLEGGADPNIPASNGAFPLFAALIQVEEGNETSEILVAHGADVNAQAENGPTLLQAAARSHSSHAVDFLLEHGSDPNLRAPGTVTPLMVAVGQVNMFAPDTQIVEALLDHGADVEAETSDGKTVFDIATTKKVQSMLRDARRQR